MIDKDTFLGKLSTAEKDKNVFYRRAHREFVSFLSPNSSHDNPGFNVNQSRVEAPALSHL